MFTLRVAVNCLSYWYRNFVVALFGYELSKFPLWVGCLDSLVLGMLILGLLGYVFYGCARVVCGFRFYIGLGVCCIVFAL